MRADAGGVVVSDLDRLQRQFQDYVVRGARDIERAIDATGSDAGERLAIYAEAYRLRLIEALETDFVALRAFVGNDFAAIARAYIDAHPSTHPSLRHFGRHLPDFLARDPRYQAQPVLADLAAFDWALTEAFDAPDATVLTIDTLAALPPEHWAGMRLRPHPSLVRLDLYWNTAALWNAADAGTPLPAAECARHPIAWAVWRQDLRTYFRSLPTPEAWALDAVRAGRDFAAVCEGLCEWIEPAQAAAHAAGLLKQWIIDGMLSDIATD